MHIIHPTSKILVTGGTGFLGSYIIKQLIEEGFRVRAIKRDSSKLPFFIDENILNQVEWVVGDILDIGSLLDAMADIDTVIHAAAVVSFDKRDKANLYRVNIEGTANVVNAALEAGVKRLVYISSVAALGRKKDSSVVDEDTKWAESKNNTPYAISKFNAEKEAWRGFAEGLEGVVVCPATLLGYGDWKQGSCALFKKAWDEFGWYTHGVNGFANVEDTARASVALMKSTITEERFIVCNNNWSFKKLFDTMADGFGKKRPWREAKPLLASIAWRLERVKTIFSGEKPLVTRESSRLANMETFYDSSKLLKTLPEFSYTDFERTIHEACRRYEKDASAAKS